MGNDPHQVPAAVEAYEHIAVRSQNPEWKGGPYAKREFLDLRRKIIAVQIKNRFVNVQLHALKGGAFR